SKPIVVTACMLGSSESWEPQQAPRRWHSRAGGGAAHSIKSGPMQCSIRSPRCCVGIVFILDPPLAVRKPALGEHFHVDFVLVGPIANNLDLGRSGELPRLPLFENNLLIGLYILWCKGLPNPLPHGQVRLVSEPNRVAGDVSRIAVVNLRSLSVCASKV